MVWTQISMSDSFAVLDFLFYRSSSRTVSRLIKTDFDLSSFPLSSLIFGRSFCLLISGERGGLTMLSRPLKPLLSYSLLTEL